MCCTTQTGFPNHYLKLFLSYTPPPLLHCPPREPSGCNRVTMIISFFKTSQTVFCCTPWASAFRVKGLQQKELLVVLFIGQRWRHHIVRIHTHPEVSSERDALTVNTCDGAQETSATLIINYILFFRFHFRKVNKIVRQWRPTRALENFSNLLLDIRVICFSTELPS